MFRRLEAGVNPELEIPRVIDARAPGLVPAVVGAIEYRRRGAGARHAGGAAGVRPQRGDRLDPRARGASPLLRADADPPPAGSAARTHGAPAARAGAGGDAARRARGDRRLPRPGGADGTPHRRDAHRRSPPNSDDPSFAPEPYSALDRRSKYQSMRNLVGRTRCGSCAARSGGCRPPPPALATDRWSTEHDRMLKIFEPLPAQPVERPAHPDARRSPPRAGALHRQGLRDHRLRGAPGRDAGRAAPQARVPARRGGDDPLVPLRRLHGAAGA